MDLDLCVAVLGVNLANTLSSPSCQNITMFLHTDGIILNRTPSCCCLVSRVQAINMLPITVTVSEASHEPDGGGAYDYSAVTSH